MRIFLVLLISALSFAQASLAQQEFIYSDAQWLHTDTALSKAQLVNRRALLEFTWTENSSGLISLADQFSTLQKEFPFLNIVGSYAGKLINPEEISTQAFMKGIQVPVQWSPSLIDRSNGNIHLRLFGPAGELIKDISAYRSAHLAGITEELRKLNSEHQGPGKTLFPAYSPILEQSIYALHYLNRPQAIAFDPMYKRLYICDTQNHRIIITNPDGKCFASIGTGQSGTNTGLFEDTGLNRPVDLEVDRSTGLLYIADKGNSRILLADPNTMETRTMEIKDEEGYKIQLPSAPLGLAFNDGILSIVLSDAQRVWEIETASGRIVRELGSNSGASFYHKKNTKTVLGNPVSSVRIGSGSYTLDLGGLSLLESDDSRTYVMLSADEKLAEEAGLKIDTNIQTPLRLKLSPEGRLFLIQDELGKIREYSFESEKWKAAYSDIDTFAIGLITDIDWGDEISYILDAEHGIIYALEDSNLRAIQLQELNRLSANPFKSEHLLIAEPIALHKTEQTSIKMQFLLPENYILHPQHESSAFLGNKEGLYVHDDDLSDGQLEIFALSDFERNQINLLLDVYMAELGMPEKILHRQMQVSIPISSESVEEKEKFLLFDLLDKINLSND